jgi:hypothetical protein
MLPVTEKVIEKAESCDYSEKHSFQMQEFQYNFSLLKHTDMTPFIGKLLMIPEVFCFTHFLGRKCIF